MLWRPSARALTPAIVTAPTTIRPIPTLRVRGRRSPSMIAATIAVVSGSTPWVKALACDTGAKIEACADGEVVGRATTDRDRQQAGPAQAVECPAAPQHHRKQDRARYRKA